MPDRYTMSQRRKYAAEIKQAEIVSAEAQAAYTAAEGAEARTAAREVRARADMAVADLYSHAAGYYPSGSVVHTAMERAGSMTRRFLAADDHGLYCRLADEYIAESERRRAARRAVRAEVSR